MSLIWIVVAGVIAGIAAKLFMPRAGVGGLFLLATGGSAIAGLIQYSEGGAVGFVAPMLGAAVLLVLYAFTAHPAADVEVHDRHDDYRRAA